DGEYQRADKKFSGAHRRAEGEAGCGPKERARECAADHEVAGSKGQLLLAGVDHRSDNVGRFYVIHMEAPALARVPKTRLASAHLGDWPEGSYSNCVPLQHWQ